MTRGYNFVKLKILVVTSNLNDFKENLFRRFRNIGGRKKAFSGFFRLFQVPYPGRMADSDRALDVFGRACLMSDYKLILNRIVILGVEIIAGES